MSHTHASPAARNPTWSASQAAMTSMKIIGDSLMQWKPQPPQPASRKDKDWPAPAE